MIQVPKYRIEKQTKSPKHCYLQVWVKNALFIGFKGSAEGSENQRLLLRPSQL